MRKHYWKYKCTAALLMLWCAAGTLAPAEGGDLIGLSWKPDYDAVRYEVQMKDDDGMFYDNQFVYANSVLLDKKGRLEHPENVSYRVRPIDFDGNPISAFTPYMPFEDGAFKDDRDAPYQKPDRSGEQGGAMLYPVYSFVWMPGAASYEVEVTTQPPENPTGTDPSLFRLWSAKTELSDLYDARPRIGTYYWRVRASMPKEILSANGAKHRNAPPTPMQDGSSASLETASATAEDACPTAPTTSNTPTSTTSISLSSTCPRAATPANPCSKDLTETSYPSM